MTVEIRLSGVAAQALAEPAEDLLRSAAGVGRSSSSWRPGKADSLPSG